MSGFSKQQLQALEGPLASSAVRLAETKGKTLHYIEGWFAIAEANAIFGFCGWDRETVHFERAFEHLRGEITDCGYLARVRVRVRAGARLVVREGTGFGSASSRVPGDAHERAMKTAETDATKRALATFGNRFGLCLYDRDRAGLGAPNSFQLFAPDGSIAASNLSPEGFCSGLRQFVGAARDLEEIDALTQHNAASIADLRDGAPNLMNRRGEHYADILLRLMADRRAKFEAQVSAGGKEGGVVPTAAEIMEEPHRKEGRAAPGEVIPNLDPTHRSLSGKKDAGDMGIQPVTSTDAPLIAALSAEGKLTQDGTPEINGRSRDQKHESLQSIPATTFPAPGGGAPTGCRSKTIAEGDTAKGLQRESVGNHSGIDPGQSVDKSALPFGHERRIRDKAHLKRVQEEPCLVCNRQPSHAHHLKFAQRRGMSQKVSDEFVVPLCALHHGDLHRSSSEQDWWKRQAIDPLPVAANLWGGRQNGGA